MKAQCKLGLVLSWSRVTTVFLVDIVVLVVASHVPESWQAGHHVVWCVGVGITVVVMVLALVSYHGITLVSGLATWVWDCSTDPGAALTAGCTPAIDHRRRFGCDMVGVREYKGRLVTVIAVDDGEDDPVGRHRHRTTPASLSVQAVADGLRQFDIRLDGIDIVSVKIRRGGNAAQLSVLDNGESDEWGLVRACPPTYQRFTWLVLRMNPQHNVVAVAARDSLASTLVAATERLAQDLDGQNCAARPLTADELAEVDSAVLADLAPTLNCQGWRHIKHFNGFATSFWVTPSDIDSETLDELWLSDRSDIRATVITIRLASRGCRTWLSVWVRYHSESRLSREVCSGLNQLTGRQLAAVRASLPAPAPRPILVVPSRELSDHDKLVLPVGREREGSTSLFFVGQ
ncbi:type VII secretion protein EccE [Mycobacterium lepromatosis]|uniref:ESX component EccE5 n=1 Tax=Mycobacterium lepromatosis TaxID=480418 RepID=A0A0F4ETW7_9MYCO|nr:type VII secretion protein EccE [Mycobacterium lepromatosis]KJX75070.1 ESX component EccE5 [Mycobacterium lepromatosis]UKN41901.1 type VII secretion protein EccE [Mycobacterium lepromatosis]